MSQPAASSAAHRSAASAHTVLLAEDDRKVGLLAFREFTSSALNLLTADGLQTFDLEHDVQAFNVQLPRLRIIPLAEFDPLRYL